MKNKLLSITIVFVLIMMIMTILFHLKWNSFSNQDQSRDQIIALNEIKRLSEEVSETQGEAAKKKLVVSIDALQDDLRMTTGGYNQSEAKWVIWSMSILCIFFLIAVFGYVYDKILKPFEKMKDYTDEIAKGNFDAVLKIERTNFFGAFTWAFDHMRREITKARVCEKEAIDNNKTVIATLSHDIKTPIASIRAYAEGLDANLDSNADRRRRYISVIMNKCDEVTKLTNDLFLHSLADLDKLKMNLQPFEISSVMTQIVNEISGDSGDIIIKGELPISKVLIDRNRFEQVLENLISNSRKYAAGKVEMSARLENNNYMIVLQDFGSGIPDENMPFIFEKFYRGKNVGDKQGSGLGLYIVKYIMEQMQGEVVLRNNACGLEVIISLPLYLG